LQPKEKMRGHKMNQIKEAIAKAPSGRVRRSPLARRNVLTVTGKEDGYQYRVVNDTEDRVVELMEVGYVPEQSKAVQVGDKRVSTASSEGTVKRISVGGGKKGVVMKIRQDWYDEDQKAKQDYVAETERATKKEALSSGDYGKLEITRK